MITREALISYDGLVIYRYGDDGEQGQADFPLSSDSEMSLRCQAMKNKNLRCSLCGWEARYKKSSIQVEFPHLRDAVQIWCPRNACKEANRAKRAAPEGYIARYWPNGWTTVELATEEEKQGLERAKQVCKRAFHSDSE